MGLAGFPQVLDDSTDQKTRDLVDDKCLEWQERGIRCECVRRTNRKGYKAGALKDVMPLSISLSVKDVLPLTGTDPMVMQTCGWQPNAAHA